jgi:phage terminase Nu1 subunit (DNA packaging protein)
MTTVKVSDFRNSIDHLFRVVNVDYHACVSLGELRGWMVIAERVLAEVSALVCKRANEYDRSQHFRSMEVARERLRLARKRIAELQSAERKCEVVPFPIKVH